MNDFDDTIEDEFDDDDLPPSKSQVKRDCDALQKLGEQLLELKPADLEKFDLPEDLARAIHEGRKIQARGALKRQRQYIGKLMRNADSERIATQLESLKHRHDLNTAQFRQTEQWRDRLVSGDKDAMTELFERYPAIDRQYINQLVRQSKKEQEEDKPPGAARKLFKYLMALETEQH